MNLREMRERRANCIEQARALLDRAEQEKRDLTDDEKRQYGDWFKEQGELKDKIERDESLTEAERELGRSQGTQAAQQGQPGAPEQPRRAGRERYEWRGLDIERATPEVRAARSRWLAFGPAELRSEELRALQADLDVQGGFLRPDQDFNAQLIMMVDNLAFVRQLATTITLTTADSLGTPSLDTDMSAPTWTSELSIGTADSSMALGKRELRPHPLAKSILVSNKLLRATANGAAMNAETLVRDRLAYQFAVTEENAFLNGTGAGQPLGVFVASASGINTDRDISAGNTTTAVGADNIRRNKYNLKVQYRNRPSLRWIINRTVVRDISLLKDGEGQYLWRPGLTGTDPDTIDGVRVLESEYAPNTMTTGLYVGIIGDFSFYWIADALTISIQRLVELYAGTNQTGFIGRLESDGMPVLSEAFSRMALA